MRKGQTLINEKKLSNRGEGKNRNLKADGTASERYELIKRNEEAYKEAIKYHDEWTKKKYWQYGLPLNITYEADLILYLDQLESIKPYISKLIRKEMTNPYIDKVPNKREFVKGENTKQRSFSLKFNKETDKDIIEYLQTKESKRAYLIGLLEYDMEDKGYKAPKGIKRYNDENKFKKTKYQTYNIAYCYIEKKINNNDEVIFIDDLINYVEKNYKGEYNKDMIRAYIGKMFSESGVLKLSNDRSFYTINKAKFNKLQLPENYY